MYLKIKYRFRGELGLTFKTVSDPITIKRVKDLGIIIDRRPKGRPNKKADK